MANDISLTGLTEILYAARDQVAREPIGFAQGVITNDGGPAFPIAENGLQGYNGMSIRDYFAGQALNAIASTLNDGIRPDELHFLTLDAYGVADAMLKAREVKP